MRLAQLAFNTGTMYKYNGEFGLIRIRVSPGNYLNIHEVPDEEGLREKLNTLVLNHFKEEGVLKCL